MWIDSAKSPLYNLHTAHAHHSTLAHRHFFWLLRLINNLTYLLTYLLTDRHTSKTVLMKNNCKTLSSLKRCLIKDDIIKLKQQKWKSDIRLAAHRHEVNVLLCLGKPDASKLVNKYIVTSTSKIQTNYPIRGRGQSHVTHFFSNLGPPPVSETDKARQFKFSTYTRAVESTSQPKIKCPWGGVV